MKRSFNDPEAFARVRRLPPLVLTVTGRLRDEAVARGVDVVDLSMGHPDVGAPARVGERLRAAAADPRMHRHLDPRGLPELRQAAARWWQRKHAVALDPDREVLATVGSKEGIGHALVALLAEGDTVLAPTPTSPIHAYGAALAGGSSALATVGPGVDFFDSLVAATEQCEKRPKGIVVSFPANPTAAVATPELLEKIVRFAEARDLFIISDLAYHDLAFDGRKTPAILDVPGAKERTLEFMSLSKSYSMAGWRVGFCAGNAALLAATARVKSYLDQGVFGPTQLAAVTALDECDDDVRETVARYERRRDSLVGLFGAAGWRIPPPAATMFAWAPIPEPFHLLGSLEFAKRLLDEAGVCVAPGIGFGGVGDGFVRIALVEDEQRLALAAERIATFLRKGPGGR